MTKLYLSRHFWYVLLPQHLLFLVGIGMLVQSGEWSLLLWSYLSWVVIGVFGVSLVYHKVYAHRAFEFRPWLRPLEYVLTLLAMLSGQGSPVSYAVIHRVYHHPNADQNDRDPHSPHVHSFWHAYLGWHFRVFHFNLRGVQDLISRPFLKFCHKHYYSFFVISYLLLGLISFKFLIFAVVIPGVLHSHEMNILNSFGHSRWFGYRNFDSKDESVNNWIFGILTWGTGFHNNHHAHPAAIHNRVRWYEFDPFEFIVPLLSAKPAKPASTGLEQAV